MKAYKNVSIFPKILETKGVSEFTKAEKKHLTRAKYRWKIRYEFLDPDTRQYKRFAETFHVNRNFPEFNERHRVITLYFREVKRFLKEGFNPFEKEEIVISSTQASFEKAKELKSGAMSQQSFRDFCYRLGRFEEYLKSIHVWNGPISEVKKKHVVSFLGSIARKSSPANSNNYKGVLSSLFTAMEQLDFIPINFVKTIPKMKSKPKIHKLYTKDERDTLFTHLKENRPELLFYIKFFSYTIIRPIDATRVRIKDFNIEKGYFTLADSKTVKGRRKSIPSILMEQMPDISNLPGNYLLFGINGSPGVWETPPRDRQKVFGKWFKKERNTLGLSNELTMYGMRHYVITELYHSLLEQHGSHAKAIDELIKITEHRSKESLMKYLRSINAIDRQDYSDLLR